MKMKKIKKYLISTALSLTMTMGLATPAMAADLREQKVAAEVDMAVADADETEEVEQTDEAGETVEIEQNTDADTTLDTDGSTDTSPETGTSATSIDQEAAEEAIQDTAKEVAASKGLYLKELRVSIQSTAEAAKEELKNAGYNVIDRNLNEVKAGKQENVVYLGYTTTDKVSEAIKDIATMNLSEDYFITDYESILLDQYETFAPLEKSFAVLVKEYRKNLEAGSPYAKASYDMLNLFYEDDNNQKLGDYLLAVDLTVSDGKTIHELAEFVTGISNSAMALVSYLLSFSTISYEGVDANFLQKLSNMSEDDIDEAKADRSFSSEAVKLAATLESYAETLAEAVEEIEVDETGYTSAPENIELLEALDALDYRNGTVLEFFLTEEPEEEDVMPLVVNLTEGQLAAMCMTGADLLVEWEAKNLQAETSANDIDIETEISDFKTNFEEKYRSLLEEYDLDLNESDALSIYYGVDRSVMEGTVAITKDAANYMNATGSNIFYEVASWAAFAGFLISMLGATALLAYMGYLMDDMIVGGSKLTTAIGGLAFVSALAAVAMLMLGLYLSDKADEIYDVSKIPNIIIDRRTDAGGNPYYVRYNAVKSFDEYDGELVPADINGKHVSSIGRVGHTWDVLYTTTHIDAGEPIQAKYKAASSVTDLSESDFAVHRFASTSAHNFNEYTDYKNSNPSYLSFKQGVAVSVVGSFFASTTGQVAILILGILLGVALMAVIQAFGRRRKKAVVS